MKVLENNLLTEWIEGRWASGRINELKIKAMKWFHVKLTDGFIGRFAKYYGFVWELQMEWK